MKKNIALILAFCLLLPIALSQVKLNQHTVGLFNGRFWKEESKSLRFRYLMGLYDGILTIKAFRNRYDLDIYELSESPVAGGLNWEEIVTELDSFYSDRFNNRLPVTIALVYVHKKAKGATPKELEEYAIRVRKAFIERDE